VTQAQSLRSNTQNPSAASLARLRDIQSGLSGIEAQLSVEQAEF